MESCTILPQRISFSTTEMKPFPRLFPALYIQLLVALLCFLPARSAFCETAILLTDEVQLKIADSFMEEGEYYRAVTEYKRFLILFPASAKADHARFRTGMAYYSGEEYESAARSFAALIEKHPSSEKAAQSRYYEGLSYWKLKRYEYSLVAFSSVAASYPHSDAAPLSLLAASLVALDKDNIAESLKALKRYLSDYPGHTRSSGAREAILLLGQYEDLPEKSPVLAGMMSAVIPGSGYMYAGHFKDGLTAFFINGLSIAGTVTGIQQENYAAGGIAGGIGLPFYFGNIYGSANAAKKWNTSVRNEIRDRIHLLLGFSF
jgi:TolA-binding protein